MVATWKTDTVGRLSKGVKAHKVIGVVGIENMPSKQLQSMKKKLKGSAEIYVARSNLIKLALKKAGVKGMDEYLNAPSGIVFSDLNPFQLEKLIYGCKTTAPAKPGSIAPYDITIPSGDTGIAAGPVIGDFQAAGVKAKIQGGKIVVSEDSLVVKKGEKVSDKVAVVLSRLGIEPVEIVLKVKAAHENGMIYPGDILHVDEAETVAKIQGAHRKAFNLAYNARVYNKAVTIFLLQEGISKARNLMINAGILNKESVGIYLAKADAAAKSIKSALPAELQAELEKKD
ncbi:MAG: 50S ribosomal protein L10 [Candidatus Altiarchaeota archaeon]